MSWICSYFRSVVPSLKYQTLSDNYDARKYGRRTNYSNIEKQAFLLKWKDILWFKKQIKSKPMVIKGIMHPDDAAKAFKYKADAIWVSTMVEEYLTRLSHLGFYHLLEKSWKI